MNQRPATTRPAAPAGGSPRIGSARLGVGLAAAGAGIGVATLLITGDGARLAWSYLVAYMFALSVSLGALFFVLLHHLTGARWSTSIRRLAEVLMMNLWPLAVLFLPILYWMPSLFEWAGPIEAAGNPELLAHKAAYLNPTAFTARAILYFAVWLGLATLMWRRSLEQDAAGRPESAASMRRWSAPGMILLGLTLTFASFDWLMSLDPYWFSTIFGVYYFSGAAVAIMAALILTAAAAGARGPMRPMITTEHFHDLGKLLFGFVIFWAYIAYSQMMLVWMANLPEETIWYHHRWQPGSWRAFGWFLLAGHFVLPFLVLLPRTVKRARVALALAAAWLLAFHYADLYWLAMPALDPGAVPFHPAADLGSAAALGLIFVGLTILRLSRRSPVPLRDPYLAESLTYRNH